MQSPPQLRTSFDSFHSDIDSPSTPGSTAALLVVPDLDLDSDDERHLSGEEDDGEDSDYAATPVTLSPSRQFIYTLSPSLKLGALLASNNTLASKYVIPSLFAFSFLAAFTRQIWMLLARYLQKSDVADIVALSLARGRRLEGRRNVIRRVVRFGSAVLQLLLVTVYLQESVYAASNSEVFATDIPPRVLGILLVLPLTPFCFVSSLTSDSILILSCSSVFLYVVRLCIVGYAYSKQQPLVFTPLTSLGALWQDIPITAFAFTSSNIVHLYTSQMGTSLPGNKHRELRIPTIISLAAALVGALLVMPLDLIRRKVSAPDLNVPWSSTLQDSLDITSVLILACGIPPLIATIPTLPIPSAIRRRVKSFGKLLSLYVAFSLSIIPSSQFRWIGAVLMFIAIADTYFLPALVHIIHHQLRRPLSIIIPHEREAHSAGTSRDPGVNELLLRKEKALQNRRFSRRIFWDIGVWLLLLPVGGGGFVWAVGRLAGKW